MWAKWQACNTFIRITTTWLDSERIDLSQGAEALLGFKAHSISMQYS